MKIYIDKDENIMFMITQDHLTVEITRHLEEKLTKSTPYEVFVFGNTESIELI
ncbi:hypothetical protein [Staphylococcus shinii]|uniref:hypothetical protein n=1 Tax=Staphylococcus shinii TaxID=2912228 RepID=UPI003F57089E